MVTRSRLSQSADRKTKKRLFLSVVGIILVLVVLVKFGVPALINFSLFLANLKGNGASNNTASQGYIAPPSLNEPFTATNSATITVSGNTLPKVSVKIYVNNDLTDVTTAKSDGSFSFDNVTLTKDENSIKVKAEQNNKESDFSDTYTVSYKSKAPSLSVDNPHDNDSFPKETASVTVSGKTDANVRVTVNGFWAVTDDSGNYTYSLPLQPGDNQIKVIATDDAGNTTEKDLKVNHAQ